MDVLGLPLDLARQRLRDAGFVQISEQTTAPPRGPIAGQVRVVQQRTGRADEIVLVTASFPTPPAPGHWPTH